MAGEVILTAKQFCEQYGCPRSKLTEILARGEIEAKRLGNRIRISKRAADEWFDSLPSYEPEPAA